MQLFYVPNTSGAEVILDENESRHAVKVLRLSKGDVLQLIDGKGGFYEAEITDPHPKKCQLSITHSEMEFGKRDFYLHLAVAPTKNIDRFEWFLEKCTEIGIDEITPIVTEHSERKVVKPERLEKILVSAMKQSVKAYLPKLNPIVSFEEFIAQTSDAQKFIAHCYEGEKKHLKTVVGRRNNIIILIGPEGDFSLNEIQLAKTRGYSEISLGDARLRTETAGIVACHIVNLAND